MIVYNVTVNIDNDVHDEWLNWMRTVHVPDVMRCGIFTKSRICKVLVDEEQGVTYSIQYTAPSMQHYEQYSETFAPALQAEHRQKFEGKFVAFRTLIEVIEDFEK